MAIIVSGIAGTGPLTWSMARDSEGYREYRLVWRVRSTDKNDGPARVLNAPGLPFPGSMWALGNDIDPWVWLRPELSIQPYEQKQGEGVKFWDIEFQYGNKPPQRPRCNDTQVDNPLLEPHRKSGSYVRFTEESILDRFGRPITTSSHELIHGPQNEWDAGRDQVTIEQNVSALQLPVLSGMKDRVNDRPMWGLRSRAVKLSNYSWEEKFYGQCFRYYTRRLEFDIKYDTFDRYLLDEGTKALSGKWNPTTGAWDLINITTNLAPDPNNPAHFNRFKDRQGENTKVILDGAGKPFNPDLVTTADCSVCPGGGVLPGAVPGGSPVQWTVGGFGSAANGDITLTHTTGCTWEGRTAANDLVSLTYDGVDSFVLSSSVYSGSTWTKAQADWACKGSNTMFRSITSTSGPDSVSVFPYQTSVPGTKFVQKYLEANFFLLGIPAVIG